MNIKSNKENEKKSFKLNLNGKPYAKTAIGVALVSILITLLPIGWGIGILLFIVAGIVLTIWLNQLIGYYDSLNWTKYFGLIALFLILSSGSTIIPLVHDYKTAERVDELLELEKETKLYYNDENYIFILFVDGNKQPLVIDKSGSTETYNRLKADFLDNKIKVERKRVKDWYHDEISEGYYLDGYKFD
jgi:energy-coupling factor transporter transmembrane protein EcfT